MTSGMAPPPPPPPSTSSADDGAATTEEVIALYQVDYQVEAKGKTLGPTKKKVTFKFGFANLAGGAGAAAASSSPSEAASGGPSYRGSEHEIIFTWSLATGRRIVSLDNRQVHVSESGQNGWTSDRSWSTAFFVRSPGGTPVSLRVRSLTSRDRAPHTKKSQVHPFDLLINGHSYFKLPKIYELGTEAMRVEPARGPRAAAAGAVTSDVRNFHNLEEGGGAPHNPSWGYPTSSPRAGYKGVPDPRNPHVATVAAESSRRRTMPVQGGVGGTTMSNLAESSPRRSMPVIPTADLPAIAPEPPVEPPAATPANNPVREASLISLEEDDVQTAAAPVGAVVDLFGAPAPGPPPPPPSLGTTAGVVDPFAAAPVPPPPAATPPRVPQQQQQQMSMVQWQHQPQPQQQPPRAASWAAPPSPQQQFQQPTAAGWNAAPPSPQPMPKPAAAAPWSAAPPSPQQQPPIQVPMQQQQRSASLAAPAPAANPFAAAAPTQQYPNAAPGAAYANYQAPPGY